MNIFKSILISLIGAGMLGAALPVRAEEDAATFYRKNKLTLVIGTSPGGASDVGARLFAKYWPEVTGG